MKRDDYGLLKGDRVFHIKEPNVLGTIIKIDDNLTHVTTCVVKWDGAQFNDIHWTNKLRLAQEN